MENIILDSDLIPMSNLNNINNENIVLEWAVK